MKLSVIYTPVHNALGITTVSASVETEASRIAQIDFSSFLTDVDVLALALYASHPSLCAQYLPLPRTDYRRKAAYKAQTLHSNPSKLKKHILDAFFHRNLRVLLEIGHSNPDFGAKLVPVFACMLEHQEEHYLDALLVENMQRFLAKRDFLDGFTIISQTNDECCIMPSPWRKEVA